MTAAGIDVGAPGVYRSFERLRRELVGARLDVCAFAGVAPRGPARVPVVEGRYAHDDLRLGSTRPRHRSVAVPISSFDDYRALYGGFEGPGLLPYAVASFFEQGGRRAYVIRVVHDDGRPPGSTSEYARAVLPDLEIAGAPDAVRLFARSEGSHGNALRAALCLQASPLEFEAELPGHAGVELDAGRIAPAGSLLRVLLADGTRLLRFIDQRSESLRGSGSARVAQLVFDLALPDAPMSLETVEARLRIEAEDRFEEHDGLALDSAHPRWMARVLITDSTLVWPDALWSEGRLRPLESSLPALDTAAFARGEDRYADITHEDFFDPRTPAPGERGDGVFSLAELEDVALLCVPDLYQPAPLLEEELPADPPSLAGPTFAPCVDVPDPAASTPLEKPELEGLLLDPRTPVDLARIIDLQLRLVDFAEGARCFTALLDVPPGSDLRTTLRWRERFDSAFAAAYTPWLEISRPDDGRDQLIRIPPSAVAAGIIANLELQFGVQRGPANEIARNVVNVAEQIDEGDHARLHPAGVNVFRLERDGVDLSAARTLSRDPAYRQLSVRRLITFLAKTLGRELQWAVFEPNGPLLRRQITRAIRTLLRRLYAAGALRGASEEEAFFVRSDAALNPQRVLDAGRLITEIGVAPTEPLEFLVVRLARDGDGTLTVED